MSKTEAIVKAFSDCKTVSIEDIINDNGKLKYPIENDTSSSDVKNIGELGSTSVKINVINTKLDSTYFPDITSYMYNLYLQKNKDYGNSFDLSLDEFGLIVSAIRLSDKFNRFKSLIKPNAVQNVKDESIKDTLIDIANYCIMTVMYMNKKDNKCD